MPKQRCETHEDGIHAVRNADWLVREAIVRLSEAALLLDPSMRDVVLASKREVEKASSGLWKTTVSIQLWKTTVSIQPEKYDAAVPSD
tara:strand:- start:458 stop:721 length:264 start_codon:yes stop_codon:yes gene_type:complete